LRREAAARHKSIRIGSGTIAQAHLASPLP
jgi:hypothetical protein